MPQSQEGTAGSRAGSAPHPPDAGSLSASGEAWEAKKLLLSSEQPRSFLGADADASCHVAHARRNRG